MTDTRKREVIEKICDRAYVLLTGFSILGHIDNCFTDYYLKGLSMAPLGSIVF